MATTLTPRQVQIMDFLKSAIASNGYPPSLREVGLAVGLTPGSVHTQLRTLETKGYIVRDPGRPRALTILDHEPAEVVDRPGTGSHHCDLADRIRELHKPWFEYGDGTVINHYCTVYEDDLPEGHVCVDDGTYTCNDEEHSVPACAECRASDENGEPSYYLWPCPTIRLLDEVS